MKKYSLIILCLFISSFLLANSKETIRLSVKDGNDPLVGAHVCLLDELGKKSYFATDIDGLVNIPYKQGIQCIISYAGYKTQKVNLVNNEEQVVQLKPDLLMLDQVIKTASIDVQRADESIYKVGVINSLTLEKQGVQNINDALRFQPNINLRQDGVLGSQIFMQGLEGQHVKLLIDGVPVIGRQSGNIDLSQIDMSQVDHIEIVEGPMSVVYGSNALAGTINIITKENKYYAIDGSAVLYGESVGQYNANANVSGNAGGNRYSLSAGYRMFDGHDKDKSTRSMVWNPKSQLNLDGYYNLNKENWNLKVGVRRSWELIDYKGDYLDGTSTARDREFETIRHSYYADSKISIGENSTISGLMSYNTYNRSSRQYVYNYSRGIKDEQPDEQIEDQFDNWNCRLSYSSAISDLIKIQAGFELNNESGKGDRILSNERLADYALWSDLKLELLDQVTFQPGIRLIHHNVYSAPVIYSAHLMYKSDHRFEAKASVGKGFRAPSMKELYFVFVDANHQIFGNEDLIPEHSINISTSVSQIIDIGSNSIFKPEITTFFNHLDDVIDLAQNEDGTAFYYANIAQKRTHGGTASMLYNRNNHWKFSLGYTLTGIGYDPLEAGKYDFQYSNDLVGMASYYYPRIDLSTQLDFKYTGQRTQLFSNGEDISQGSVEGYSTLNWSATKNFAAKRYVLTAGVKNILDVDNISSTTSGGAHSAGGNVIIAWGRSYFLSFKFNLKRV
ncbi:TonB-dependent receptor [Reichenbachiella versicolor]|uniref:TonB-dependent receptor n=1 Tax=Reichenbachiella versicolor TaxID=1821036 RepID=UPI000D6DC59F|nr:TonB-dependent receptor [Reichenbachiella versicolor]